jgi:PAS domain-containing protein
MSTISAEILQSLGLAAHQAAGSDLEWQKVAERLEGVFDADGVALFTPPPQSTTRELWAISGSSRASAAEYEQTWWQHDPWRLQHERRSEVVHAGFVLRGDALVARRELERTAFFNEFAKTNRICRLLSCCVEDDFGGARRRTHLSIFRGHDRPDFGDEECQVLSALLPTLRGAVRSHWALRSVASSPRLVEAALDAIPQGVFVVTVDWKVQYANALAASHLERGTEAVRVSAGRVMRIGHLAVPALGQLMASAVKGFAPSVQVAWSVGGRRHTTRVCVRRLAVEAAASGFHDDSFVVVFDSFDPGADFTQRLSDFCSLHRLTVAQRALLLELSRGHTVKGAAAKCDVSVTTARTQVRRMLLRTGESRLPNLLFRIAQG